MLGLNLFINILAIKWNKRKIQKIYFYFSKYSKIKSQWRHCTSELTLIVALRNCKLARAIPRNRTQREYRTPFLLILSTRATGFAIFRRISIRNLMEWTRVCHWRIWTKKQKNSLSRVSSSVLCVTIALKL